MSNVHKIETTDGDSRPSPNLYPTATAEYIFEYLVPEFKKQFLPKNAGYGDMHNDLGLPAQYVDIHRKIGKLRRAMWDGLEIGPESIDEVLFDLIGHCFLTLDLLRSSKGKR